MLTIKQLILNFSCGFYENIVGFFKPTIFFITKVNSSQKQKVAYKFLSPILPH